MGFKVFQGQESDANLLPVHGKSQVFAVAGKFQVEAPKADKGAKPVSQAADEMVAFINEDAKGRTIIVLWEAAAGAQPTVASPRTQTTTVATSPGDWLVTPDKDNVEDTRIDGAFQAKLPSGRQPGQKVTFTTSMCGLDQFIVTYRSIQSGKTRLDHVIIQVRKRIHCHLFEMKRSARGSDTIDDYRDALAAGQKFFADNFGIDLVFPGNGKIVPEGTTPFVATRNKGQLPAMIPAANASSRKPTDLWINVVHAITGDIIGLGGKSMVSVEVKDLLDGKKNREGWVANWHAFEAAAKNRMVFPETWVKEQFHPALQGDERQLALNLADGRTTPERLFQREMLNTLLHEIGHALGLVPTNEMAGGVAQSNWRDAAHSLHCATQSCIMFFEAETAQLGVTFRIGDQKPFDHSMDAPEQCTLFLKACDLSDLRRIPV